MMPSIKFVSFDMNNAAGLAPAPSIAEEEAIREVLKGDMTPKLEWTPEALLNKELKILTDYRGGLLYTEGGLQVVRINVDRSLIFNQYTGFPEVGTRETVKIGDWYATVEYV